jgi:hypothetical protein
MSRPWPKKKTPRKNSPYLKKGLAEINMEIKQAYSKITGVDKLWDTYTKINSADAEDCFQKYKGRCVYCDTRLSYLGRMSIYSARLAFYVPLKVGGEARPDNLIVVCAKCKHDYRSTRKVRTDVTGLDTFADLCEALFLAVEEDAHPSVLHTLKNRLNLKLTDVATCMRYVTKGEWVPEFDYITGNKFVKVVEGENTLGEQLEQMGKGEDVKADITQTVKQVVTTKQYKIMRNQDDE